MKTYQKPELILQSVNIADVLTTSGIEYVDDVNVKGNAVEINWDQL